MSWGVYNWNDLVGKSLSIEPILSTEVSMTVDYDVKNISQQSIKVANELSPYCSQNLSDLQFSVSELQHDLKEAIATADRLNAQKELLQQRVQILERCLKSSQLERSLSQISDQHYQPQEQFQQEVQVEEEPLPHCQTLQEAMQVIRQLQNQLKTAKFSLQQSQKERIELARAIADQSQQQMQQLLDDQENITCNVYRNDSEGTETSDALYIAEEMSYKVVVLQSEKEELGDALAGLQLENFQIKTVNEQLEQQVKYLLQQTGANTETKQPAGTRRRIFRRRLIKA